MKQLRIYADTSVFGGCFDPEFADVSGAFFEQMRDGGFVIVVSMTTLDELDAAPEQVRKVLGNLPDQFVEVFQGYEEEIDALAKAYMEAGIIGRTCEGDARHIATASVAEVDFVVSWNFKHIVHYDKIQGYQAVNLLNGYKPIVIYSPREVI